MHGFYAHRPNTTQHTIKHTTASAAVVPSPLLDNAVTPPSFSSSFAARRMRRQLLSSVAAVPIYIMRELETMHD